MQRCLKPGIPQSLHAHLPQLRPAGVKKLKIAGFGPPLATHPPTFLVFNRRLTLALSFS